MIQTLDGQVESLMLVTVPYYVLERIRIEFWGKNCMKKKRITLTDYMGESEYEYKKK